MTHLSKSFGKHSSRFHAGELFVSGIILMQESVLSFAKNRKTRNAYGRREKIIRLAAVR